MNTEKYKHITDNQLLEHFNADKNNEWLGILLHRYTLLLFGVCMKYLKNEEEAKDAVQQVFLKTITELHKYKVDYFKSWIYMVAKNHCLMKLRKNGNRMLEIDEQIISADDELEHKSNLIQKEQSLTQMEWALHQLNSDQQQCLKLFYLEKQSYQEISVQSGFTLLQIKSHIQNGKRNLKIMLERRQHEQ